MTDTVNVPQEMIDAVMKIAIGVDEYGSEVFAGPFLSAELVRAMLAAAPKAEPVSDPYKLEFEPCYGCGANEPSERCLGCSHDFQVLNRQETIDSSEAPKVEQEPYAWAVEVDGTARGLFYEKPEADFDASIKGGVVRPLFLPDPASAELLGALEVVQSALSYAGQDACSEAVAQANKNQAYHIVSAIIAQHKGPQS